MLTSFQDSDRETDDEEDDLVVMPIMLGDTLKQMTDEGICLELPKYHRCGAHTVNLMATVEVSKVSF